MISGMQNNATGTSSSKCASCRKKSHVLLACHCSKTFCITCRIPEKHRCDYKFKEEGKKQLEKQNPVVSSCKIDKI